MISLIMNGNICGNIIVRQDKEKVHQHWYTYQSYSYIFQRYLYYIPVMAWLVVSNIFFPYIGNHNPNWLIFFRGIETTNQWLYNGYIIRIAWDTLWFHDEEFEAMAQSKVRWFRQLLEMAMFHGFFYVYQRLVSHGMTYAILPRQLFLVPSVSFRFSLW